MGILFLLLPPLPLLGVPLVLFLTLWLVETFNPRQPKVVLAMANLPSETTTWKTTTLHPRLVKKPAGDSPLPVPTHTPPLRLEANVKQNQPNYDNSHLPFPMPVPRDLHVEALLPKLVSLFPSTSSSLLLSGPSGRRLVNLGAGVRDDDPTFPLLDTGDWDGLLMDGDPNQEASMAERFPSDKIQTHFSYITADSIPALLKQRGFDQNVDLLKIDIDSFDCFVMEAILKANIRPSVIVMEVNVKFPANLRFAMLPGYVRENDTSEQYPFDSEQRGHLYGCSLAYQVHDLMRPNGYEVLYLDTNNAVFYDDQQLPTGGLKDTTPLSMTDLYNRGYYHMPDRAIAFSFNNELTHWQQFLADKIFIDLVNRSRRKPLLSHGNHHILMGDLVNDGNGPQPALTHGCFDSKTGLLMDAETNPEACSWSAIPPS